MVFHRQTRAASANVLRQVKMINFLIVQSLSYRSCWETGEISLGTTLLTSFWVTEDTGRVCLHLSAKDSEDLSGSCCMERCWSTSWEEMCTAVWLFILPLPAVTLGESFQSPHLNACNCHKASLNENSNNCIKIMIRPLLDEKGMKVYSMTL